MKLLEIIVTHYKEPWETGRKLFEMIGLQRCIDFGNLAVTIVNDGGQRIPEEDLARLRYPVRQVDIPHGGVSAARNEGIRKADAEWIMFCDFDDTFTNIYSLREIMSVLPNAPFDLLWCQLMAEDYLDGKQMLRMTEDRTRFVFCHGKVYRRQFLIDKDIWFDEKLVFNEDSCLNNIIVARTHYTRIGEIKAPFPLYVWIRREASVTNSGREDEASYGHFRRNLNVTAEYKPGDDRYNGMVTRTAYDAYYMTHGKRNSEGMRQKIAKEFAEWMADKKDAFGMVEDDILRQIRDISKRELLEPGENIPDSHERVSDWVYKTAG